MELQLVDLTLPGDSNLILGQSHFIKTVEDLYEVMVNASAQVKFGLAFCEASGPCLIRAAGNDEPLQTAAIENAKAVGAGHSFVIMMQQGFPVNVLNAIKQCPEVCRIYCATANPVQVVIANSDQGRGILGVIDGFPPKGVEGLQDVAERQQFLRLIGYKL
ncbi:adenosine monophosphate-protein transferase [Leptolyngbya sp. Heron Island J]|uniref:adenosine-specific kinase n=1 Tax=Leptolyngbya sp. Heron Island J TaxID=1385935 RepID=UPI0003B93E05|nr:adenosine-specific kinase [Leptolyngbya sp. Heron Island J]ESA37680.1 adenosine monophosphate-protein transferase [Leptolyngbya sp. Heron Island J]